MKVQLSPVRPRRGRPRKFPGPSRAVTLTLPESTIATLSAVDPDLSRAIVRVARAERAARFQKAAELATFGRYAVIVVTPTPTLQLRTGVQLVPLPDGRALISFDRASTIERLELRIADALEDPRLPRADRKTFETIGDILRNARRSNDVTLLQRSIIVLEARRPQSTSAVRSGRRSGARTA